ncbi:MAG: hypothetical protein HYS56_05170 [Candidatus Omnitrophica bacterium]|nr:hypothetical protein [Candidatus Omnitrophota bacterium]
MGTNAHWLEYLRLCWKGKWVILTCFLLGIAQGAYQYLNTNLHYESEATLMLSETGGGSVAGLSSLFQIGQGASNQEHIIQNVLQSRRMAQGIAEHFDFEKRYALSKAKAIKKASSMISVAVFRGIITLVVMAEEKQLAIDAAYFCIQYLEQLNGELQINSSRSWVKVLDPPELSVRIAGREKEKRFLLLKGLLGLLIGVAIACGTPTLVEIKRALLNSA